MNCPRTALLSILFCLTGSAAAESPNPTRLYVKTEPSGAQIAIDGRPLGSSGEMFTVDPGERTVQLTLSGFEVTTRQVEVEAGRITRLEVQLVAVADDPNSANAVQAAIGAADLGAEIELAMEAVLRQYPHQTRWSGRSGNLVFGIACKQLPKSDARERVKPAMMELVHSLAVHELVTGQTLLDLYAAKGLTDANSLKQAVLTLAPAFNLEGTVDGLVARATSDDHFAIGYAYAKSDSVKATLLNPQRLEDVRNAYRDVVHRQARELMKTKQWADAIALWKHLHDQQLVSQSLYLDAARCLKELDDKSGAHRLLEESMGRFKVVGTPHFFEAAGDLALELQTPASERLAESAYIRASEALRETVTTAPDSPKAP